MHRHYSTGRVCLFTLLLFFSGLYRAQQLGIYEFSGSGSCPNQFPAVTAQPGNALFSDYHSAGVACFSSNDVFNASQWNTTAIVDPDQYYAFTLKPLDCFSLSLTQLQFSHRVSPAGGTPVIHVRSNQDGFTADIYTISLPSGSVQTETVSLGADFSLIADSVTFRFYVTDVASAGATYRHDNVSVSGTVNTVTPVAFYQDADSDGFGNGLTTFLACTAPVGYVADQTDCDDTNPAMNPAAEWYADTDADGAGNAAVSVVQCSQPAGYVLIAGDCDDTNPGITAATAMYYADNDGDGWGNPAAGITACSHPTGYVTNKSDCDDGNGAIGVATSIFYRDSDTDGFGNPLLDTVACSAPSGYVADYTDCDDTDPTVHPLATEIPNNGTDEDCSGTDSIVAAQLAIYEFTGTTCAVPLVGVTAQPSNAIFSDYVSASTTCGNAAGVFNNSGWNTGVSIDLAEYNQFTVTPADCYALSLSQLSLQHRVSASGGTPMINIRSSLDNYATDLFTIPLVAPNVTQTDTLSLPPYFSAVSAPVTFRIYVTGISTAAATYRNDNVWVSGLINPIPAELYYADMDTDGFGNPAIDSLSCKTPVGYVSNSSDCNDASPAENPLSMWYQDLDEDGFGNPSVSLVQCLSPMGYVSDATDCDDTNPAAGDAITWFADADSDGFGNFAVDSVACSIPAGYVANHTDCDDGNAGITVATQTYYIDADSDGYGKSGSAGVLECAMPVGYSTNSGDCNDANPAIYPTASDASGNGVDENCDGIDGSLGLSDFQAVSAMLFPNPGTDEVSLALSGNWDPTVFIRIFATDGKELLSREELLQHASITFSTVEFAPGLCLVQVTDGVHTIMLRWMKK